MLERISENEKRLDAALLCIKNLEAAISDFVANGDDIKKLNEYYGSPEWFGDKESYERGDIPKIKAGVLSEDAVWNMNEEISELISEMDLLVKRFSKEKDGDNENEIPQK